MMSVTPKGSVSLSSGEISGWIMNRTCFFAAGIVSSAVVYAPMAMKPACPRENRPVKPLMRFMDSASTMLMAHRRAMRST